MEASSVACFKDLKRCWMRRKYKRLGSKATVGLRRLKVEKLGGSRPQRVQKTRKASGKQILRLLRVWSRLKLLAGLHDAYVKVMFGWASGMRKAKSLFWGKKVAAKGRLVTVTSGEQVDVKLVFEVYKRVVISRNLNVSELPQ